MRETSWEYAGRTVDEAIQISLEELGLERDDIHVEVLEESQKGFLGLGGKEARIRVDLIGEWEVEGSRSKDKAQQAEEIEAPSPAREEPEPPAEEMPALLLSSDKPESMVRDILGFIGVEAMVESREREDSIVVDVWGDDVAILIGKGGATLDAMQYLVNIGCRRGGEASKKIILDVEGYRKRRKAKIEKQAQQMAKDAASRSKSMEMPPMSASERKVVHMALRQTPGIWTESQGEEPDRRVVIHPESQSST